ncbi:MAG: glycosyltransferase family A protein [Rikenellaceae bacterium]
MYKVSILVPLYGVELYIEKCARSLMEQSYENCEFVFINDASKDRSLERLKECLAHFPQRASQIKIVDLEVNGGVAAARNAALDNATGEYCLFVDADDWVDSEIVERLLLHTIECDADICNAWCASVGANGEYTTTPMRWLSSPEKHLKAILGQSHLVHNHVRGVLFRRSLFEENKLRFTPGVDFGEDYSLLPKLLYYSKRLTTLPFYLYFYRIENEGSYMNNIGERQIQQYIAASKIVKDFVESLPTASLYRRSLEVGQLNIKKWIFKRKADPKPYDELIFGELPPKIESPLLRLYNRAINGGNPMVVTMMSVVVNLPIYLQRLASRL